MIANVVQIGYLTGLAVVLYVLSRDQSGVVSDGPEGFATAVVVALCWPVVLVAIAAVAVVKLLRDPPGADPPGAP